MKKEISIRQRIYWSFSLLIFLFVINGIITIVTISDNKKLSSHLSAVIDPSLQALEDFKKMMLESKMYTTNWIFLRSKQEDKKLLKKLHEVDYIELKTRINSFSARWQNKTWTDSLNRIFLNFEELLAIERSIMASLKDFKDYDDPVIKLESERKVEEEIIPRTACLMNSLNAVHTFGTNIRAKENDKLENSSVKLGLFIILLAATIILAALFLSMYLARIIIGPINKISHIINDLGHGIIRKIDEPENSNEIAQMTRSLGRLSDNLKATTSFAHEIGLRNFDMPFKPLSDKDALGKALISMRENLKNGETNLELKNKELERKNKELEEFAFVASHDLQEPLRTTSSYVELLKHQYKGSLDERADKYLEYISQASGRMQVLITDLLEYSRIGTKKEIKEIDCNVVLKEVLADLDKAIKETGAEIVAGALPFVCGYPTEIKQLFQNLIINSLKFRKKDVPPLITICAWKKNDCWQFAFSDNGIGIEKKHNERIFVIFQRLHNRNEYKGSGIGLSQCKKIVELHKGKIWLESQLGQGATFYFTIPQSIN